MAKRRVNWWRHCWRLRPVPTVHFYTIQEHRLVTERSWIRPSSWSIFERIDLRCLTLAGNHAIYLSVYLSIVLSFNCSYFVEQTKCFENFLNTVPCMRPHVGIIMDLIQSETGSLTSMMCGEYNDSSDACEKLGPAPAPVTPNKKEYLTPVSMFIDLLASMDASALPSTS